MSILAATRSVSLLGASFRPTPPRLSPPQLDLSSPPPALLVTDTGSSSTRSPLVELILESPVINASLDKSVVRSISKQRSRARCYVIDAVQDSAISDTEETPNEVHMQANQKQNRSVKPKRRPVPTTATEAGTVSTVLTAPPPPPNVQWVGSIHCNMKPLGKCLLPQAEYSTQCTAHACQAILEDGRKCGNLVPRPRLTRFCKQGYHKETGTLDFLEDLYASRQRQNDIEREQHMAELKESRDWVLAIHPELKDAPPVTSTSCQPIPCGANRCHKTINPEHVFGCYSPGDWIGGMWQAGAKLQPHQQHPGPRAINAMW